MAVTIIPSGTPMPQWLRNLSSDEAEKLESWPPARHGQEFDWTIPTNEQYHDPTINRFASKFAEARKRLDYEYHRNPVCPRQELQDAILTRVLAASNPLKTTTKHTRKPWLVFTAGAMGAGKGYVLSTLHNADAFPMSQFVMIDPDKLKNELPEMAGYLQEEAESAATKVHRESTFMSDVLFEYTLLQGRSLVVDGSLRDVDWYSDLFARIRREYPLYQIGILHVSAERSVIHQRARKRAELSNRVVPTETIDQSIAQVPKSVNTLAPLADVVYEIDNGEHSDLTIRRKLVWGEQVEVDPEDWDEFATVWASDDESDSDSGMNTETESEVEGDDMVFFDNVLPTVTGSTILDHREIPLDDITMGNTIENIRVEVGVGVRLEVDGGVRLDGDGGSGETGARTESLDIDMYDRAEVQGYSGPKWIASDSRLVSNDTDQVSNEVSRDFRPVEVHRMEKTFRSRKGSDASKKVKPKGDRENWLKSSLSMLSPCPKMRLSKIGKLEQKKKIKKKKRSKMTKHVKRTLGKMRLSTKCCMATCWDDAGVQKKANDVWKQAYPSFCPRCTLTGDSQCGVCIHGDYSCACRICGAKSNKTINGKEKDKEKDWYHLSCPVRAKFFDSLRFFDPAGMTSMMTKRIKD
ncbi:hypothetical protein SARC_09515 [Sphaeroforma arctica JP610]|uniref:Zeta toxin domain-containing protein n=1 Tax=Sphaeroforma arctica JP610 TaxID=667725 RepID=A0A0L0FMQ6_9EUKA|nr:hypothetical protein SARC_09515 [Sphaeroforma arctica JP610]KNC78040.1 hypothetical protein SARC_09515 [Sphaeroforma arctica JP610]|eukprot:XP_014151942.1 hypothetical protein SARC_09515 [Sphaeroforma arctica JP610]